MGGYSTIKPKIGSCADCGKDTYLTAGRCRSCYWQHRGKISAKKPAAIARKERKQDLTPWFNLQLTMAPARCENVACQELLRESMAINPRAIVAHILPKRTFEEIATHPLNRVFLCNKCHYKYDNGFAETMPELLDLCRSRLAHFQDQVSPDNYKSVPNYLVWYAADRNSQAKA